MSDLAMNDSINWDVHVKMNNIKPDTAASTFCPLAAAAAACLRPRPTPGSLALQFDF